MSVATALSNFIWLVVLGITAFMVVTVILLVVRERYREIAIRRVEGARRHQIALQLVLENVILSLFASGIGLPIAFLTGRWLEVHLLGWPVLLGPGDVLFVVLSGTLIIGLATALPARRASSIDPVSILSKYG
jgi:ABC-type antimicrobial peptide transport system permease subunit